MVGSNPLPQPVTFADLELARRLERTEAVSSARFVEARLRVFPESGAAWMETAGVYAMFDGPDSPVTQTFGLGLFAPATPEVLDQLEDFFLNRGAAVNHEVSPLAGIELFRLLVERGCRPMIPVFAVRDIVRHEVQVPRSGPALRVFRTRPARRAKQRQLRQQCRGSGAS